MISIPELWLPILVSAVFVFLISSVIHMVLGYHANDFKSPPNEGAFADAIRKLNLAPGDYGYPMARTRKEMNSPEYLEKRKQGPLLIMTTWSPADASMGRPLVLWFLFSIIVGMFAAYVAGRACGPDATYLAVFRFAGVTSFVAYTFGGWPASIWYKRSWTATLKNTFDGLVYGLVTGGVFGWLWPRVM
jgi:hypothetical protein